MPFIQTKDNCSIYYEIHKNILPETTLFIHGNMSSCRWWYPLQHELKSGMPGHMILVDLRGFGNSTTTELKTITVDQFYSDCIELIQKLELGQINLVGHSTGGITAAVMAAKHQQMFNKILLIDPVAADGFPFPDSRRGAFKLMLDDENITAAAIAAVIHGIDKTSDYFKTVILPDAQKAVTSGLAVFENLAKINYVALLQSAKIKNKTLVLHGELDNFLPIEGSKNLAILLAGKFMEIKNHGHSVNVENPRLLKIIMDDFIFDTGGFSKDFYV